MALSQIKHVIYYMLENRSFDNVLGWLYDAKTPPQHIIATPGQQNEPFYGLEENKYYNCFADDTTKHYVTKGTDIPGMPDPDPHEEFEHMNVQLFGVDQPKSGEVPSMSGFLKDYHTSSHSDGWWSGTDSKEKALQILRTYSPEQLSVLNGLAKHYAVSDQWFASVPSQTNCNRAFSLCGTSLGLVNNQSGQFDTRTIWDVLNENGFSSPDDWMIYYQTRVLSASSHGWQVWKDIAYYSYTEETFKVPDAKHHIAKIDDFFDAAAQGRLPAFSYLEPDWIGLMSGATEWLHDHVSSSVSGSTTPNSYHPPSEVISGEQFLKKLYDAMNATPEAREAWKQTVLIISFDENGGTYDHVPPPWGATPPWGKDKPLPEGVTLEQNFPFDRFGVRVPMLVVSPLVEAGTVFRSMTDVPYDHTSTIATILNWKGIPKEKWNLGERTANAPTWDNVLTRATPRDDFPEVKVSKALQKLPDSNSTPYSQLQAATLPKLLQKISGGTLSPEDLQNQVNTMLTNAKTFGALHQEIANFAKVYEKAGKAS